MTILHLIRSSAFSSNDFEQCIINIEQNDDIVLLDDGCYNLKHPLMAQLLVQQPTIKIYVINNHVQARALNTDKLMSNERFKSITMSELVPLTFSNNSVVTWQ